LSAGADRFTFAVVGHNEAPSLASVLEMAFDAAEPGDEVWFVDSASTDDSAAIAERLDATVVPAPLGKGNAIAAGFERLREGSICYLDGDVADTEHNIARLLRRAAAATDAEMVVGEVDAENKRGSIRTAIYRPLVAALFPEAAEPPMMKPISGFRVLRAWFDYGELPGDFGIEPHLNITVAINGGRFELCPLGYHRGPTRYERAAKIGGEVARTILDLAEAHGRLDAAARPAWEAWLDPVLALIAGQPPDGAPADEFMRAVRAAAARPLPPPR
jgi:glucosyl-3-phosphoglycerate synthase